MRIHHFIVLTLLVSGCAMGPRSYDGVLGYRTEPLPEGVQVTYVDEADNSNERILSYIAEVCDETLGPTSTTPLIELRSVSEFEQQVAMSVQIPVGVQGTGTSKSNAGSAQVSAVKNSYAHSESVFRNMKLKKVVALCATDS
ncbi:hypothetical protein [Marinobacter sp. F4216]|uniref:hypothetical protein n=1 Tax=Marinobacter sp. F4216 TaxID=2874281 RepID=UPI001CBD9D9C|nr:hypothetical protein [Marinobacter sp. F4216]MBZ2168649.1 hypothetical protein [Marinobacter sp. F4216]